MGNLHLRALRLTPAFMKLYKEKKFTSEALAKAKLSFSNVFEELPITIRNTALLKALLFELETTDESVEVSTSHLTTYKHGHASLSNNNKSVLAPSFDMLDLSLDPYVAKNLENLMDTIDDHHQEQGNYAYWQRSVERENKKKAAYILNRVRWSFVISITLSCLQDTACALSNAHSKRSWFISLTYFLPLLLFLSA